jgi:hypothetical protein
MKNINAFLLLLFCAAGIAASAFIMLKKDGEFMIMHFIGSAALLLFVLTTTDFSGKGKAQTKTGLNKLLRILAWTYNAILVVSCLAMAYAATQHFQARRKEMGNMLVLPALILLAYAIVSISYYRKVKK